MKATLALRRAHDGLVRRWTSGDPAEVGRILADIARDERILAAAACGDDGRTIASTPRYPQSLACERVSLDCSS